MAKYWCGMGWSDARPTDEQEPKLISSTNVPGMIPVQPRHYSVHTSNKNVDYSNRVNDIIKDPVFAENNMRNVAYRANQWLDKFWINPDTGVLRFLPAITVKEMREWGEKMSVASYPWELRMNPKTGMTPAEAIETAEFLETNHPVIVEMVAYFYKEYKE